MVDYSLIFQSLLILQEERYPNAFDYADTKLAQKLVIKFAPITKDKATRLRLIGSLVGREIASTKLLKVSEVEALLKLLERPSFITDMRETTQSDNESRRKRKEIGMDKQRIEITTTNFEPVIKHLTNAIKWLDSEQPENAVMFHLGMHLAALEAKSIQLSVGLIPVGFAGRPALCFDKPYIDDKSSFTGMSKDCFTSGEIEVITQGITSAGGEIFEAWNGAGMESASFALAQFAGESVARLVRNYSQYMHRHGFSWPSEATALYNLAVKPECWI